MKKPIYQMLTLATVGFLFASLIVIFPTNRVAVAQQLQPTPQKLQVSVTLNTNKSTAIIAVGTNVFPVHFKIVNSQGALMNGWDWTDNQRTTSNGWDWTNHQFQVPITEYPAGIYTVIAEAGIKKATATFTKL